MPRTVFNSAARLSCPFQLPRVHRSGSPCLSVSLSQQTGSTNWPLETASSGADVYIFSHFDDDLNRQNLCQTPPAYPSSSSSTSSSYPTCLTPWLPWSGLLPTASSQSTVIPVCPGSDVSLSVNLVPQVSSDVACCLVLAVLAIRCTTPASPPHPARLQLQAGPFRR